LEKWQEGIAHNNIASGATNAHGTIGATGNPYKNDATIFHFGMAGNQIAVYKLIGCFPSDVPQLDLSWDTKDTIIEYSVTFSYDYWIREGIIQYPEGSNVGDLNSLMDDGAAANAASINSSVRNLFSTLGL
jgi:hypothetical protein